MSVFANRACLWPDLPCTSNNLRLYFQSEPHQLHAVIKSPLLALLAGETGGISRFYILIDTSFPSPVHLGQPYVWWVYKIRDSAFPPILRGRMRRQSDSERRSEGKTGKGARGTFKERRRKLRVVSLLVWRAAALKSEPRKGEGVFLLSFHTTAVSEVSTGAGVAH